MTNRTRLPLAAALSSVLALLLTGCGTPMNEVVPMRDGSLRAPTSQQASAHCDQSATQMVVLRRAPGDGGVIFRCE